MAGRIFIVHESPQAALRVADALGPHARVSTCGSAEALLARMPEAGCAVVAADLGGMGARGLLAAVRDRGLPLRVVVLVQAGEVALAAKLLRAGASDVVDEAAHPWRLREAVRGGADDDS
jgi:FixJ family two-component response regulator